MGHQLATTLRILMIIIIIFFAIIAEEQLKLRASSESLIK